MKISTTEIEEFGRKFDIGIGKLTSMDNKLDRLDAIDGKLDRLEAIDGKLGKLDVLVEGQDRMGDTQDKMLKVLEKIEDKL